MHGVSAIAFPTVWATVLFGPPFSIALFLAIRQWWPHAQLPVTIAAALILLFAFGAVITKLSFTNALVNVICVAAAYCIYCLLAASSLQIRFKVARYILLVIAVVPIAFGYVLGTVGVLGLGWIVMDYTEPPKQVEQMGPDLICKITGWGSAVSASGYSVHLYKDWSNVRFLHREVVALTVVEAGYKGTAPSAKTCADALKAYAG